MNAMPWLNDPLMMLSRFVKSRKFRLKNDVSDKRKECLANMKKTYDYLQLKNLNVAILCMLKAVH